MIAAAFDGVLAVGIGGEFRATAKFVFCACATLVTLAQADGNFRRDGRIVHRRHGGGALGRRGRGGGIRDGELVFLRGCAGFDRLCRAAFPVVVLVAIGLFGIGVGAAGGISLRFCSSSDSEKPTAIGRVVAGPPPAELEGQSLHRHG